MNGEMGTMNEQRGEENPEILRQLAGCDAQTYPHGFDQKTVCGRRAEANGRCILHGGYEQYRYRP